jgi:hypothetical protein
MPIDQWFRERRFAVALGAPRPDYLTLARWRKFAEGLESQVKQLSSRDAVEIISARTGELMFNLAEALAEDLRRDWSQPRVALPTAVAQGCDLSNAWSAAEVVRALVGLAGNGDLQAVRELFDLAEMFRQATTEAGQAAVRRGRSCAAIARVLGVHRSGAHVRFGRPQPEKCYG